MQESRLLLRTLVDEFQDSEGKKEEAKDVYEHARVCCYPHCAISNLTLFVSHGSLPPVSRRTVHYALLPANSGQEDADRSCIGYQILGPRPFL